MAVLDSDEEQEGNEDEAAWPPSEPLRTREVFLDTESYKRQGYDAARPSLVALKSYVGEDRLRLHMADVTWREIERQLTDQARGAVGQIKKARATLAEWRKRAPQALGRPRATTELDADAIAQEAISNFRYELPYLVQHAALQRCAQPIFEDYFERRPPFDSKNGKSVKEFPDAFVIAELDAWCIANHTRMYVVTYDGAMRRAAAATQTLIPLPSLDHLLQIVTIEHSPDVLERGEAVVDELDQSDELAAAVDAEIGDLGLVYVGELYEGEATTAARAGDAHVADWTVIFAENGRYGFVLELVVDLLVDVDYEDLSMASYDREDGVYFGAESSETQVSADGAEFRMFVETNEDGKILRAEMLTSEIEVHGDVDWYK